MKTKLTNADMSSWPEELPASNPEQRLSGGYLGSGEAWMQRGRSFQFQVCVVWMILKDPRTPWYTRVIAAGTVGYLFSPVQLIPSFIPIIGLLDDFAVLWLGFKLIQRFSPTAVVQGCNAQAARMPPISAREMKRVVRMVAIPIALAGLIGALSAIQWLLR